MSALAKKRSPPKGPPKGWRTLHADVCWEDHGGLWCKRDRHSSSKRAFNLLKFERCEWDERDSDESPRYECGVSWIDLDDVDGDQIAAALKSCGWRHEIGVFADTPNVKQRIVADHSGDIIATDDTCDLVFLDALVGYGGVDWGYEYKTGGNPARFRASCIRGL